MPTALPGTFKRGLSPSFVEQLTHGTLRALMDAIRGAALNLEVRRNYINVYSGRNSVLKLEYVPKEGRFCAIIHQKYNPPAEFILPARGVYAKRRFSVAEAEVWATDFLQVMPQLIRDAAPYDKPEGGAEFGMVQANRQPPFLVLDRQVQLHRVQDSKVDMLGLSLEKDDSSVVLVELKQGHHLKQKDVLAQIDRYRDYYQQGGALRRDVADRLDESLALKRALGLLNGQPDRPLRELPIEFLVVLVSEGKGNPPPPATVKGGTPVHYVGLNPANLRIPARKQWQPLRVT